MKRITLLFGVSILLTATAAFAQTLPEGVTQAQMDAALSDLSALYGSPVVRVDQAKAICNQEQYLVDCAKIGQEHGLFSKERAEQVGTLLIELKGQVVEELKQCGSTECLVAVATAIARRLVDADPNLAQSVDLTPQKVEEKRTIVETAKSIGIDIRECQNMDPDTATIELLRACARLAKHENIQKFIPEADRGRVVKSEGTTLLKEALARGEFSCGDNTIEGCGAFCLNPSAGAREGEIFAIPDVCRQIAARFFGEKGNEELELAHRKVQDVFDVMKERFVEGRDEVRENTNPPSRIVCPFADYSPCPPGEYRQESINELGCYVESACIPLNTKTEPPPIDKRFICPALPTVDSCPAGEEKVTSFSSPECGTYFVCRPKQNVDTGTKYPHTFKSGRIVVSFEETRIYCFESGTNGATLRGDKGECEQKFGISVPNIPPEKQCSQFGSEWHSMDESGNCFNSGMTEYLTSRGVLKQCADSPVYGCTMYNNDMNQPPQGQKEQMWNSFGLRSWIRTNADSARIESLKLACREVRSSQANVWMPNAGTQTSEDFGMPDPDKCKRAALCTTSQYFNGTECTVSSQWCPPSQYWNGTACVTQTATSTTTVAQCNDGKDNDNDGKIDYPADIGCYDKLDNDEVYEGNTRKFQCQDGIDNDSDGKVDFPADPECYDYAGDNEAINTGYKGDANSCPSFAYSRYDRQGARYCQLNYTVSCQYFYPAYLTQGNYAPASCPIEDSQNQVSGGCSSELANLLGTGCHTMGSAWFNGSMTMYVMPGGSIVRNCATEPLSGCSGSGQPASGDGCPSGQYRDGSGACVTAPPSCTSGQYWNGSSCVASSGGSSCGSGQYWNGSSCVSSTSSGGSSMQRCFYPNASRNGSPVGYTVWCESDYVNCHEGSPSGASVSMSGLSLGAPSSCESGWPTGSGSTCTSGQYWNGSSCVASSGGSSCGSGQYWNGSSCVASTGGTDYSSAQSGCASAGGSWDSTSNYCVMPNSQGACASGQYWNGSSCVTSQIGSKSLAYLCPSGHDWNGSHCTFAQPSKFEQYVANVLSAFQSLFRP